MERTTYRYDSQLKKLFKPIDKSDFKLFPKYRTDIYSEIFQPVILILPGDYSHTFLFIKPIPYTLLYCVYRRLEAFKESRRLEFNNTFTAITPVSF